jgi:hypothetical protein
MGYPPTTATAFELEMRRLGLDERTCAKSKEFWLIAASATA